MSSPGAATIAEVEIEPNQFRVINADEHRHITQGEAYPK
jgi:hypothetical protein